MLDRQIGPFPPRALPPLRRRWRQVYGVLWLLALPLAVGGPLASSLLLFQRTSLLPFGITILQDDTSMTVTTVWGSEARKAGVRPGDRLVTVGSRAVRGNPPREEVLQPPGTAVQFGFARNRDEVLRAALPRDLERERRLFAGAGLTPRTGRGIELLLTLLPMVFLVAAALALFRRRDEPAAAFMSLAFLLVSATSLWLPTAWRQLGLQAVGAPLGDAGWTLLAVTLLAFPTGRFAPRWTGWAALAGIAWFLVAAVADPPADVENGGYLLLFAASAFALVARYRRLAGAARLQMKWAFLGFAFGISALAAAAMLLDAWPILVHQSVTFVIWVPLVCFFLVSCGFGLIGGGLLVALLRYRLYDAEALVSRSAAYAAISVLIALIFAVASKALDWAVPALTEGDGGPLPQLAGAAIAVGIVAPARDRVTRWADLRFRKPLTDLQEGLPDALDRLTPISGLGELADEASARIADALHPARLVILAGGGTAAVAGCAAQEVEEWRSRNALEPAADQLALVQADRLFPLRLPLRTRAGTEPIGWLLLGPRPDGSHYRGDEREALGRLAAPLARALKTVVLREAAAAELAARLGSIEAALDGRRATDGTRTAD